MHRQLPCQPRWFGCAHGAPGGTNSVSPRRGARAKCDGARARARVATAACACGTGAQAARRRAVAHAVRPHRSRALERNLMQTASRESELAVAFDTTWATFVLRRGGCHGHKSAQVPRSFALVSPARSQFARTRGALLQGAPHGRDFVSLRKVSGVAEHAASRGQTVPVTGDQTSLRKSVRCCEAAPEGPTAECIAALIQSSFAPARRNRRTARLACCRRAGCALCAHHCPAHPFSSNAALAFSPSVLTCRSCSHRAAHLEPRRTIWRAPWAPNVRSMT